MQMLPSTFRDIHKSNPSLASLTEPRWNIAAGVDYDRYLYKRWLKRLGRFDDHLDYTFASYNAGFGRISKAFRKAGGTAGEPLPWQRVAAHAPRETRNYVKKIRGLMERAGAKKYEPRRLQWNLAPTSGESGSLSKTQPIVPARGPPAKDDVPEPTPDWDLFAQSEPEFEFDQRRAWLWPSSARLRQREGAEDARLASVR